MKAPKPLATVHQVSLLLAISIDFYVWGLWHELPYNTLVVSLNVPKEVILEAFFPLKILTI